MKWLLRFFAWSTLLAIPAIAVSGAYQKGVIAAAAGLFGLFGLGIEVVDLEIMAPVDIALFLAMVLASRRAAPARRKRALIRGVPALAATEVLTIAAGMALVLAAGAERFEASMRGMRYLIGTVPWVAAPLAWWILLAPFELPPELRRRWSGGASRS